MNFSDEVTTALRLVDGVVIVVDAVEGLMVNTERLLRHVVAERLPMTLVINKVDRLILELKLPPNDAYFKLRHTIEEVNSILLEVAGKDADSLRMSPDRGNVTFASSREGWSFTCQSFAQLYMEQSGKRLN